VARYKKLTEKHADEAVKFAGKYGSDLLEQGAELAGPAFELVQDQIGALLKKFK
jgi:hypothetical protein